MSVVIPGNAFPVTEHPFKYEANGETQKLNGKQISNSTGYLGKSIRNSGYQSHFTFGEVVLHFISFHFISFRLLSLILIFLFLFKVETGSIATAFPVSKKKGVTLPYRDVDYDPTKHADELVIFQDAQTLPLFVFYL